METVQILELFGGIGAPRCALKRLNIPTKAIDYVEIDEAAVRSYNAMFKEELPYKTQSVVGWNLKGEVVARIADALNTTTDYLLGVEKKMDFDAKYYEIRSLLKRNTHYMTNAQKVELISAILEIDN